MSTVDNCADNGSPLGNDNGHGDLARRCPKGGGPPTYFELFQTNSFPVSDSEDFTQNNNCLFSQEVDLKKAMFFKARDSMIMSLNKFFSTFPK